MTHPTNPKPPNSDEWLDRLEKDFMDGGPPFANDFSRIQAQALFDYLRPKLLAHIEEAKTRARIDEILMIRAVGDRVAAQAGASFEELSGAYDAHILKRAADLTTTTEELENK